ncbi:transposase, partial [Streptomyces sp. NPDC058661]|uniref:transposase n=1 Tax=Streptomyces sp. NPDC058661 TaxID=3346582 RepID=UPI003646F31E
TLPPRTTITDRIRERTPLHANYAGTSRITRVQDSGARPVFLLPAYSPDLNPVEGVWVHVKCSLANLAVMALDRLESLVRNRLKRLQYRPPTLDGFIAGTGLALNGPVSP